jgi:hypothetical protein
MNSFAKKAAEKEVTKKREVSKSPQPVHRQSMAKPEPTTKATAKAAAAAETDEI